MADQTVAAVRRFSRFYTRQLGILDEGLLDSPYTLAEVRVMYEIAHGESVSAVDLTEQLRLDPGYLSRILQRLHKSGLIRRHKCPSDGRKGILSLTERGAREFAALDVRQDRAVKALLEGVGASARKRLNSAMQFVERTLGGDRPDSAPARLRPPGNGDMAWIAFRFSRLFWEEYGYDERFEALVCRVAADFLDQGATAAQRCWIADRAGERIGAALVMRRSAAVAQMRLFFVEPESREMGLGTRLARECVAFARASGYRKLMLWTQNEEQAARRLYRRLGFQLVAHRPHRDFTRRKIVAETWELAL